MVDLAYFEHDARQLAKAILGEGAWFATLWDHIDGALACFLCDNETARPPFAAILPEISRDSDDTMLAGPLCAACAQLDKRVRMSRLSKTLRRMHQAHTSKRAVGFHFMTNQGR
jgi:hypothetical protein